MLLAKKNLAKSLILKPRLICPVQALAKPLQTETQPKFKTVAWTTHRSNTELGITHIQKSVKKNTSTYRIRFMERYRMVTKIT